MEEKVEEENGGAASGVSEAFLLLLRLSFCVSPWVPPMPLFRAIPESVAVLTVP